MKPQICVSVILMLVAPRVANAAVYFDSLNVSNPTFASDGAHDGVIAMADSFTAATPDFSRVILNLSRSDPNSSGSALVYLVPDDNSGSLKVAGRPTVNVDGSGNFVSFQNATQIGAIADQALSTTGSLVSFNFSPAIAQAASASATN